MKNKIKREKQKKRAKEQVRLNKRGEERDKLCIASALSLLSRRNSFSQGTAKKYSREKVPEMKGKGKK